MKFNTGQRPEELDELYTYLCDVLERRPSEEQERVMARLCLLLLGEMSDKARAMALMDAAESATDAA